MAEDVTLKVDLIPSLYELVGAWVEKQLGEEPTGAEVIGAAATMFYASAQVWQNFDPPSVIAAWVKMDEDAFLELARQMWRKSAAPTPTGTT